MAIDRQGFELHQLVVVNACGAFEGQAGKIVAFEQASGAKTRAHVEFFCGHVEDFRLTDLVGAGEIERVPACSPVKRPNRAQRKSSMRVPELSF